MNDNLGAELIAVRFPFEQRMAEVEESTAAIIAMIDRVERLAKILVAPATDELRKFVQHKEIDRAAPEDLSAAEALVAELGIIASPRTVELTSVMKQQMVQLEKVKRELELMGAEVDMLKLLRGHPPAAAPRPPTVDLRDAVADTELRHRFQPKTCEEISR